MLANDKIELLRQEMKKNRIDAYIVNSSDAHQSEYVPAHFKSRAWLSGFTGSNGTLVVTLEESGLWTDGRYFIQAEKQLSGSEIKLFKMNMPGVPEIEEYLFKSLSENAKVAIDGRTIAIKNYRKIESKLKTKKIAIKTNMDLVEIVWKDRPELPKSPLTLVEEKYSGESLDSKLSRVKEIMSENECDYYISTDLNDIAWLLNIRSEDIDNNPLFYSYVLISRNETIVFIDGKKLNDEVVNYLYSNKIIIQDYSDIGSFLASLKANGTILLEENKTSHFILKSLSNIKIKYQENVLTSLRAIKNEVELENLRKSHIRDGVNLVKFFNWIEKNVNEIDIDEYTAGLKLQEIRKESANFMMDSFDYISAFNSNAAMMHYKAEKDDCVAIEGNGMYLIDSGAHFLDGSTDITRTIAINEATPEMKYHFTYVLKSMLNLSKTKFLEGAVGSKLDMVARLPLWSIGIDYKCGTGHGVGFIQAVHEGYQNFSMKPNSIELKENMILTNEPGIYLEDRYGIRTENSMVVRFNEETEHGRFLDFETITFVPIDLKLIDIKVLTDDELDWINNYHKECYDKLSPYLEGEELEYLKEKCELLVRTA